MFKTNKKKQKKEKKKKEQEKELKEKEKKKKETNMRTKKPVILRTYFASLQCPTTMDSNSTSGTS